MFSVARSEDEVASRDSKYRHCFEVNTRGRGYLFAADTAEEMEEWVGTFEKIINSDAADNLVRKDDLNSPRICGHLSFPPSLPPSPPLPSPSLSYLPSSSPSPLHPLSLPPLPPSLSPSLSPSPQGYDKVGYLKRKDPTGWKRRWFTLKGKSLACYRKEREEVEDIDLRKVVELKPPESTGTPDLQCTFQIITDER